MGKSSIGNRKIQNATAISYHGKKFKSKLELTVYKTLKDSGMKVRYEPKAYVIWEGFYPSVICYSKGRTNNITLSDGKLRDITYTPDFIFRYNGYTVIVEAKGFETDVFKMKFKLFRKLMEKRKKVLIFEVFNKRMVLQMLELLNKDYGNKES